jgi:L-ascorbate metabolism protein UlaG (beta-lactamase superfamily)
MADITFTWYGHGAMDLLVDGKHLLVDPFLSDNPAATAQPDTVPADYILISHGHGDHVGDAVPIAKRTGAPVVSNFEICNWFESQGVAHTHAQHIGGGCHMPFGYLKLTLALHGSALPDGSDGGNPVGFLLNTGDKKVYLAGDTGLSGDMQLIGDEGIDLAVLPIGDHYTMGPDDALRAVKLIRPRHVIPVHYNTYDVIRQDAGAWAKRVEAETSAKAHVLQPGGSFQLE